MLKDIRDLINLMNQHGLTELEVEREGMKIRLRKGAEGPPAMELTPAPAAHTLPLPGAPQEPPDASQTIASPMVGTFYRAPAPDAPSFVEVGQSISPGDVVCIIEAMKLMNEIKSDVAGIVTEILTDNGEPVEFGQPLFRIQPA